jgi:transcriptional regulator with XRE-family HTH domain|nr:MAG TPA: helix-turn-helix domain protein [Caudoviricetes sp.]
MRSLPELVEFIRVSCKSRNSSITKMEKDLSFANGTVGKWANGKRYPPKDKLLLVADFLQISIEELMGQEPGQKEKPNALDGIELEKLSPARRALLEALDGMDDENIMKIVRIAQAVKKELPE